MVHHQTDEEAAAHDARMSRAIVRGVAVAFPLSLIGLTLAIWLITDLGFGQAFMTAVLPGILLGGFAGGFAGVAKTMD